MQVKTLFQFPNFAKLNYKSILNFAVPLFCDRHVLIFERDVKRYQFRQLYLVLKRSISQPNWL
jgi:hypothetical protein